jgi:hypothetical protein
MSMPSRPRSGPRPIRGLRPLRSVDRMPLPVGQKVGLPSRPPGTVSSAVSTAVQEGGFTIVETNLAQPPEVAAPMTQNHRLFAERSVRRVATDQRMRVSLWALVGAGVGLGALDAFLFGRAVAALPWCLGGLVLAGLVYWGYGRTYESEVIVVSVSTPELADPRGPAAAGVVSPGHMAWNVGRVRSILFGGARTAVAVKDCPVPLMEALATAVHRFEAELGRSVPRASPAVSPSAGVRPVGLDRPGNP